MHYKKVAEAAAAAPEQWQATLDITAARLACDLEIAEAEAALHLAEIQVSTDATSDGKSAAGGIIEGLELARVRHKLGQISGGVVVAAVRLSKSTKAVERITAEMEDCDTRAARAGARLEEMKNRDAREIKFAGERLVNERRCSAQACSNWQGGRDAHIASITRNLKELADRGIYKGTPTLDGWIKRNEAIEAELGELNQQRKDELSPLEIQQMDSDKGGIVIVEERLRILAVELEAGKQELLIAQSDYGAALAVCEVKAHSAIYCYQLGQKTRCLTSTPAIAAQ